VTSDSPSSIIFINRFFYPDHSATSQIMSDLAFYLANRGMRVRVITGRQRYDKPGVRLPPREAIGGVEIHRIATTRFGRRQLTGRALDYLSFYISAMWALLCLARRRDIVVAMTDPPMLSVPAAVLAALCGFKTVNWLQDLYPELATELGISGTKGFAGRGLIAVRNHSLRRAEMNVAIGSDMAKRLNSFGVPSWKTAVIQNWTDDSSIAAIGTAANPLRQRWQLEDKFVVAYSGNLGRAHDIETLLEAAEHLKSRTDIVFLFIGSGHGISNLDFEVRKRGLSQVMFQPYQPRSALSQSLGAGDVHWLSLKAGLDGLILPSKFYGIAAAGRPIIIVSAPDGELAKLVSQFDCGFHVALGQGEDFARAIVLLAANRERRHQMGINARRMLETHFTKAQALERWYALLRAAADA
jgi:glycosyltransferase involved in cell wall biosynthesis